MSFELDVEMTVSSFPALKSMYSTHWPTASDPVKFPTLENELKDKIFLHFGCGEGEFVKESLDYGTKLSVGFNAPKGGPLEWEVDPYDRILMTSSWRKIHTIYPYDVILIDQLLERQKDVRRLLQATYFLLEMSGIVCLRCRPWSSRHGGLLNKAFAHLVFSPSELEILGLCATDCQQVTLEDCEKWFDDIGFIIKSKTVSTYKVPNFFKNKQISTRLEESLGEDYFNKMQIDFCDYILQK